MRAGETALITGCAGFLGAHLARALVDQGCRVFGADLVTQTPCLRVLGLLDEPPERFTLWKRTVLDEGNIAMAVQDARPDWVFHLAGQSHINASQEAPAAAFRLNVMGTVNLLEACRHVDPRPKAIVVASSNHSYGSLRDRPQKRGTGFSEDDALDAADVYGASKAAADLCARAFGRSCGVPVNALRHANTFGPADIHSSHVVTGSVLSVLRGESPVINSDGTAVKPYLYVDDTIAAYLRVAELAACGAHGQAFNAAPDAPISTLALVDLVIQAAGVDLVPDIRGEDLSQKGYVEHLDSSKLRAMGWAPRTRLAEGLRTTYNWYRRHNGMDWAR